MLTTLIIVLLGLALFAYVALPLILPQGADPLPLERDPVTTDLEEEKEALFRAIRELDARQDLSEERRDQLRARYEAKAARVLRQLDERASAEGSPSRPRPSRKRGIPYGALTLLGLTATVALMMGAWVLPRVGDGTLTTFFERDLESARQLRDLERAAERDPDPANLLALGDAYWSLNDAEGAREAYSRAVAQASGSDGDGGLDGGPDGDGGGDGGGDDGRDGGARNAEDSSSLPQIEGLDPEQSRDQWALAYRRLGFLTLQEDLEPALAYLERSRSLQPGDLDTLYAIGEVHFALGDLDAARDAWEAFLDAPGGSDDPQVVSRLQLLGELEPVAARVAAEPSQENLLELADVFWRYDERSRAVEVYFQVLTQHDPNDPTALGRTGQLMFLSGRNEDAIMLMERAATSNGVDAQTLLFLGNAYYSAERYEDAISAWERHLELVPEDRAGRVPDLIEDARAQLAGSPEDPPDLALDPGTEGQVLGDFAGDGGVDDLAAQAGDSAGGESNGTDGSVAPGSSGEVSGEEVYAANCASCHGPGGMGGAGPRLAGSQRAANESNVRSTVRFGRGMMPGFGATLSEEELEAVIEYVVTELSGSAR